MPRINFLGACQLAAGRDEPRVSRALLRLVGVGGATLVLLTACSTVPPSPASSLEYPGSGTFAAAIPSVPAELLESLGGIVLCVTHDSATVTSVTPVDPTGGLTVTEWGLEPNPFQLDNHDGVGQAPGPLPATYKRDGAAGVVTGHCPPTIDGPWSEVVSELGITVRKPGRTTASAAALMIHYRIGDQEGTLTVPYAITLCAPGDTTGNCRQF